MRLGSHRTNSQDFYVTVFYFSTYIRKHCEVNRAFAYSAPRMYNSLPDDVKEARNIDTFKRKLKIFLFTEAYNLDSLELNATYIV